MNAPLRSHRYAGMPWYHSVAKVANSAQPQVRGYAAYAVHAPNREHSPPDDVYAQQYRRDAAAALIQPLTARVSEQPIAA